MLKRPLFKRHDYTESIPAGLILTALTLLCVGIIIYAVLDERRPHPSQWPRGFIIETPQPQP